MRRTPPNTIAPLLLLALAGCGGTVREPEDPRLAVVQADALAFGSVLAGAPRALDVTLTNGRDDDREYETLGDIEIGIDGAGLSVDHDCPARLRSRASCTIRVTAAPQVAGSLAGTLRVASSAGGSPERLVVSGTAVDVLSPIAPAFAWGGGVTGSFGSVEVGKTATRVVPVVNRGSAAGTAPLRIVPADAPWTLSSDCGASVAAGATCNATLVFTPTAAGTAEATLELADAYREGYAPLALKLRGSGF